MSETIVFIFMVLLIFLCTVMAYFAIRRQAAEQGTEVTLKKAIKAGCKIPNKKRFVKFVIFLIVFTVIASTSYLIVYNAHLETCPLNHSEACECVVCEAQSHNDNCDCYVCEEFKGYFKERHAQDCGYIECVANHDENCNKGECVCICDCETCDKTSPRMLIIQMPLFVLFSIGVYFMMKNRIALSDKMAEDLHNDQNTFWR